MTRLQLYVVATILILIGLVFLVVGLNQDTILWQIGLGSIALAMLFSLASRWVKPN
jgi:predicted lysophospholipase L1 biosynthesis ABC-type transport system permease subunit